jgi:fucose permease
MNEGQPSPAGKPSGGCDATGGTIGDANPPIEAAAPTVQTPLGAPTGPPTWVRWQIFAILWILVLLNFIDRATLSIALPMISEEFSLRPEVQGVILGSFFWTYLIFQIPGGWLLDKLGPRTVVGGAITTPSSATTCRPICSPMRARYGW